MTVTVTTPSYGGKILTLTGRFDHQQIPKLEQSLTAAVHTPAACVLVDMTGVTYINSGGMRVLVSAWRKSHKRGGDLILAGLSPRILELFEMVGFDNIFKIFPIRKAGEAALETLVTISPGGE